MKNVTIYTDGACSGNPGKGGWGAVLMCNDSKGELFIKKISGSEAYTTNNAMELSAAIQALELLKDGCMVNLYTDSEYVKNGITLWIKKWQLNNWRTASKQPVANAQLWQKLLEVTKKHTVNWHWVKGHADNAWNNEADRLARAAIKSIQ